MGSSRNKSQGSKNPKRSLHPPFPDPIKFDKVTNHHKWLCTSSQEHLPVRDIACSYAKKEVELVKTQKSIGFFNRLFSVPKPINRWRPILDLSTLNQFLKTVKFKMETPETISSCLQPGEWITSIEQRPVLLHPNKLKSGKHLRFHVYQGYKDPPVNDCLVRARSHLAWVVDELSLSWGGPGCLCLPTSSHMDKVMANLQDYPCRRIILIALRWPNMPWLWDLVTMSSQIPLCMPRLPWNPLKRPH